MMTLKEACEFLRVSHATVYRWIHEGRLRAFKAGRGTRFRKEDLLAALEEWRPDPNMPPVGRSSAEGEDGDDHG